MSASRFGTGFMDPDRDPGGLEGVEGRLRHALHHEAQRLRPSERLDHILSASERQGTGAPGGPPGPRRWLAPAAAAAAVAVIAGTIWTTTQQDDPQTPTVAGTTTAPPALSSSPAAAPTTPPTTAATSPSPTSSLPVGRRSALPVYFVGPVGGDQAMFRLYREFLPGRLPSGATDADRARAALDLAVDAPPFRNSDGYLQPWAGTTVQDVAVAPGLITITLDNAGAPGVHDKEVARVAVQSLVWTAQAAVGKGPIPVTFRLADGSSALFGRLPAAERYNRPASRNAYYQDLAPIWITSPTRDAVLPANRAVAVEGEATVFEATVSWQLTRGATEVKKGLATASVGAPGRGSFSFSLGSLAPGRYTIRVFEPSMKDGTTVSAEKSVTFSVG